MVTQMTYDRFVEIYKRRGYDLSDRDEKNRARKVPIRDWFDAGRADLQRAISQGISLKDTIATPDITPWLPQVIETSVVEAMEPLLVLNSLFERMSYEPGVSIEFPAMGALTAEKVAEGQAYPEKMLSTGGATVTAKVGKFGLQFSFTEEALSSSRYDILGLHMRAAARALARLKEENAANLIAALGQVAFDNFNPTSSAFGPTTGRGLDGGANGSLILDNIFDAFSLVMSNGFMPDTLLLHPLAYILFLKDADLRAITLAGGNQVWFGSWTGSAAKSGPGSRVHVSGGQSITPGVSETSDYSQAIDSAPVFPSRWPWPLKIVVSPWIPFDAVTMRTDVIVCDSGELGFYIEEHGVKVDDWEDLSRDVRKVKLKERYCYQIANEGLAVATMKNVRVTPNQIALPAQTTLSVYGGISEIDASTRV
jgi:hypothetical protein